MKKLLFLGLLSLAGVSLSGSAARACSLWDCLQCCCPWRCCNQYTTKLCVRPYNAFSPVAYGNIVADGCMPMNVYGGHLPPRPPMMPPPGMGMPPYGGMPFGGGMPNCCYGPECCMGGGDVGSLPAPGSFTSTPPMTMPAPQTSPVPQGAPGPQFPAPTPQLINPNPTAPMPMQMMLPPPNPVQPAAYFGGYQPMYNPYYANPTPPMNYYAPVQAPSYWYGR